MKIRSAPLKCYTREEWHGVTNRLLQLSTAKDLTVATCSLLWCSLGHTSSFRTKKTCWRRYADNQPPLHFPVHSTAFHSGYPMNQHYEWWMGGEVVMVYTYPTLLFQHILKWVGHNNQFRSPHESEKECYCCVDPRDKPRRKHSVRMLQHVNTLICTTGGFTFQLLQTWH